MGLLLMNGDINVERWTGINPKLISYGGKRMRKVNKEMNKEAGGKELIQVN